MQGQMTIFEYLYPEQFDPLKEVARMATCAPIDRAKLIKLADEDPTIQEWAKAVRKAYCPYGFHGRYGMLSDANRVSQYEFRYDHLQIGWVDSMGEPRIKKYRWHDFAREIMDLIWCGEYSTGEKEEDER